MIAITLPPVFAFAAPIPLTAYRLARDRRAFAYRRVFSNATLILAYGAASVAFHAAPAGIAGPQPGTGLHVLTWTGVAAGCGVLTWLINHGLLVGAIRLADPEARIGDLYGDRLVSDLIEFSMAVSLALVVAINPVLMVLALPSVLLYRRYLMSAQLVTHARIDAATGVLNAPMWRHEAEAEVLQALRARTPLALVVVEIDHFSSVKETAGREAADQVLRRVAGILTQTVQEAGQAGRLGGEEFAVVLPTASEAQARRLGERIRDHVAGEPVAIEDDSHAGYVFRLTVSIGVALLDQSGKARASLMRDADAALAEAKATGRNRVCVFAHGQASQPGLPGEAARLPAH